MKYLLTVLMAMFVLVGCNRDGATIVDNQVDIEEIIEEQELIETQPITIPEQFKIILARPPTIVDYCTEENIRLLFKNTVAAKKDSIHFADGKLKFVNIYWLMDFTKNYEQFKHAHGLHVWREKFDCDDFAQMFMVFLKMHILSLELLEAQKIANAAPEPDDTDEIDVQEEINQLVNDIFTQREDPEGLAVGEIWYYKKIDGSPHPGNHAINIILLGPTNYVFIEPQDSRILTLTEEEINSIYFIRF